MMFSRLSLNQKLLLLAVLPIVLVTGMLTYYHSSAHLDALKQSALINARLIARVIAAENISSLSERNKVVINHYFEAYFSNHPDLLAVNLSSQDGKFSIRKQRSAFKNLPLLYQKLPVLQSNSQPPYNDQLVIGFTEVWMKDNSKHHFSQTIKNSLYILSSVVFLTLLLIIPLANRITSPLKHLTKTFDRVRQGDYSVKIPETANDEIQQLQKGFNDLTATLLRQQNEVNETVEQMTGDLQTTLQTVEIQNVELDIARREAVESSRVKSEFLANMSHEIRTPMNAIVGYTELLRKSQNIKGEDKRNTEIISHSAQNLLQILNDILDFSKLESGKIHIFNQPFNLRETLSDLIQMYKPLAHKKHLDLIVLIYDDLPAFVTGDRLRISQIIANLISNAIKFTEQGQIVLRVMLEEDDDTESGKIRFSVTDTGIGIAAKHQKALFRPFKQLKQDNRGQSSTGLGLFISQSLATLMSGRIELESELNSGSTFSLVLPLNQPSELPAQSNRPLISVDMSSCSALLIDSLRLSRLAISNQLSTLGLQVSAFESLSQWQDQRQQTSNFDLLCISLAADEISDFEAYYHKNSALFEDKALMLIVATSDEDVLLRLQEDYGAPCLSRPVVANELRHHIRRQLKFSVVEDADNSNIEIDEVLPSKHILIVDDNDINRDMMWKMLNDFGCKTDSCSSGYEAVEKCATSDYDLILMDIHMPELNGIETTKIIKADHPQIPVMALTADVSFRDHLTDSLKGFSGILIKPVEMEQLQKNLIDFFSGKTINLDPNQTAAANSEDIDDENQIRNLNQALRITGGSVQVADQLLNQLITLMPEYLLRVDQHSDAKEWDELWQSLHKLHGAASVCGVPALNNAINTLQNKIKNADYFSVENGVKNIKHEAQRLIDFVEKEKSN